MGAPKKGNVGTVYLVHFEPAFKHARHYLGWTSWDVDGRIEYHVQGNGSRLVAAAVQAGCAVKVIRTWTKVDRNFERRLKNRKESPKLCPLCTGSKALERGTKKSVLAAIERDKQEETGQ